MLLLASHNQQVSFHRTNTMTFKMNSFENGNNGEDEDHREHEEEEEEEGQWRNLTTDVLALIIKRLNTMADLCRFRSICKPWRSIATPHLLPHNHLFFPLYLPPLNPNSRRLYLSLTLIYLISPKPDPQEPNQRVWIARVSEIRERRWDLLNPLTKNKPYFISGIFRKRINLLGFRNVEVGRSYRVQLIDEFPEDFRSFDFEDFSSSISIRKVVVDHAVDRDNIVSVLGLYNSGEIAVCSNARYDNWKIIKIGEKKENRFDDVICYDGRFFAVDRRGRLVMINPATMELEEIVAATPMAENQMLMYYIYLVEANHKLYMVNKIVNPRPVNYYDDEEEEWVVDKNSVGRPLGFNVYVLNEKGKNWEKVENLGNWVLFVSRDATFSVNAEELRWRWGGNCVFFEGLTGYDDEADLRFGVNGGVYSLDDGVVRTFDEVPERTEIFLPPLDWFSSREDEMQH